MNFALCMFVPYVGAMVLLGNLCMRLAVRAFAHGRDREYALSTLLGACSAMSFLLTLLISILMGVFSIREGIANQITVMILFCALGWVAAVIVCRQTKDWNFYFSN